MDYQSFVALRQATWETFAERLTRARLTKTGLSYDELERLTILYRQVLHDQALAAARYPGTALTHRLRRLAVDGTHYLQRDNGDQLPSLRRFFNHQFPDAMHRLVPRLALTVGLFILAVLFGLCLTALEPALGMAFLNQEAVEGLKDGRLWTESIFAVTPSALASSAIATNNLSVAITGWAGGALAGLGAFYVVLLNGLMLGSVIAITAHYSLATQLFAFVAAHGPLEITLILVTAAAGLEIGRALVMATDLPRTVELRAASRRALIVLLGCLPWILLLGFVEGFLSPSSALPTSVKVALGLLLEVLFFSVAWNPWRSTTALPAVPHE